MTNIFIAVLNVCVSVVFIYKMLIAKSDDVKFMKKFASVIEYLKSNRNTMNIGEFAQTVMDVMANHRLTDAQIKQINDFIRQIIGG